MSAEKMRAHVALNLARRRAAIWFWKPQWHRFGWKTLLPFMVGHDEYARRTIVIGWTITGRAIIPLWFCGSSECLQDALEAAETSLVWYDTHCPTCDTPIPGHTETCAVVHFKAELAVRARTAVVHSQQAEDRAIRRVMALWDAMTKRGRRAKKTGRLPLSRMTTSRDTSTVPGLRRGFNKAGVR